MVTSPGPDGGLAVNGIDVDTGRYLVSDVGLAEFAGALRGESTAAFASRDLKRRRLSDEDHLGVMYGRNPQDLASVGWGVVVPEGMDPEVLDALEPLLRLREQQAGDLFRRLELRPDEDKDAFLARHGMGPGVVDPRRVPYYLLLVGTPEQVPFEVQYQLGVQYAVGRLDLEDPAAVASYVATVVGSESRNAADGAAPGAGARMHLFATRNPADAATGLSANRLVQPLDDELRAAGTDWEITSDIGVGATRVRLEELLTGADAPDLLFTASHGVGGRSARRAVSGALLCQDWPGPLSARGPLDEGHYLAADHLRRDASIGPKVVFSFACFGAGTPRRSDYPSGPDGGEDLGDAAFTAPLPQRLLGASGGGALAFVGHVDRAWSCSFLWKGMTAQVTPYQSTLLALMDGVRLGAAMESLTSRYAELSTELALRLDGYRRLGRRIDDEELVGLWTAMHDARAHVVLGDPAVQVGSQRP